MPPSKMQILNLYKLLLRESSKFSSYNFRMYGLRRIRDAFRSNRSLSDPGIIEAKFLEGKKSLEVVKRQVVVQNLFKTESLVIEKTK